MVLLHHQRGSRPDRYYHTRLIVLQATHDATSKLRRAKIVSPLDAKQVLAVKQAEQIEATKENK